MEEIIKKEIIKKENNILNFIENKNFSKTIWSPVAVSYTHLIIYIIERNWVYKNLINSIKYIERVKK